MTLDLSISPDTAALCEALRKVPYGQEITFAALSQIIGRDVKVNARHNLAGALRIVLRDHGAAFQSIRGVGYKRLHSDDAPEIGTAARRKQRRTSQRAVSAMAAVARTSNGLTPEAQRRLSAEISTHGLLIEIAADKNVKAQVRDEPTTPAKAAAAFIAHIGGMT